MSEIIRSLIFILIIETAFFAIIKKPVCSVIDATDFVRRRNLWFALTIVAFVTQNFWIYTALALLLLFYAYKKETNPIALFCSVLFVLPVVNVDIPGVGGIRLIFELSNLRLLELAILFPLFLSLRKQSDTIRFGRTNADKIFALYLILNCLLYFRDFNITNNLRSIFYLFIDVFLGYYVFSRVLKSLQNFRETILSLLISILILAPLGVFEFLRNWLLYSALAQNLSLTPDSFTDYLERDGMLRAAVTTGQSIVLGYLFVVGIGLYIFFQRSIQKPIVRYLGLALLFAGSFSSISRGPWVGLVFLFVTFIATGKNVLRNIAILAFTAMFALSVISFLPGGQKVLNLLPFVGTVDAENVSYREDLITNSLIVIKRNFLFGSTDYLQTPELESMRQGQGIIDIVNSYIQIALSTGVVGLGLFVAFFAFVLWGIYQSMQTILDFDSDEYLLGRVLFSSIASILIMIFTVSSITFIPIVYWSLAGMGVAYSQMIGKNSRKPL